jgi:hypothetical protein
MFDIKAELKVNGQWVVANVNDFSNFNPEGYNTELKDKKIGEKYIYTN